MMSLVSSRQPAPAALIADGNVAWAEAVRQAARCGEWLAAQGYQLLGLEIDHRGPCIRIAYSPRALTHLDGSNLGRFCLGGQTRWVYAARRFDCSIKWETTTCN